MEVAQSGHKKLELRCRCHVPAREFESFDQLFLHNRRFLNATTRARSKKAEARHCQGDACLLILETMRFDCFCDCWGCVLAREEEQEREQ